MIISRRCRPAAIFALLAACLVACTTGSGAAPGSSGATRQSATPSHTVSPSDPVSRSQVQSSSTSTGATSTTPVPRTSSSSPVQHEHLRPRPGQLTRDGMWWAVDSVAPIGDATLHNVRDFYRGSPVPVAWGRYVGGSFAVTRAELAYARAHGIGVYFVVADDNCSGCGGGDACGNDITAAQAIANARVAVREAKLLRLPRGVTLYKDIEEVGACHGELTAAYLIAWYRHVRRTQYVPAFYGNSNAQDYDFPRAYCAAVKQSPRFARDVTLAQDEPEPQLGAARRTIGPKNAPRFAPYKPSCTPPGKVRIWQYGESIDNANSTDVDQIVPGTHGILAPDGHVT